MSGEEFFEQQTGESEVKARIVGKYFEAWANVMVPTMKKAGRSRLGYLDTHSGPGRYEDGSPSTPLLVLQKALASPDLCRMLVTIFNDLNTENCNKLRAAIKSLPDVQKLTHQPIIFNKEIDSEAESYFRPLNDVPTFSFVDPWGYKSISRKIIKALISDFGCDCVFFFNYRRVNAAFTNPSFKSHVDALFGEQRADSLRALLPSLNPHEREIRILEELSQALKEVAPVYVLPFVFKTESGARTSHCLVFVSKHERGLEIMKDIMAKESSVLDQGVPTFTYSPADERTPLLFSLSRPLDALEGMLLERFAGKTMSMVQIYKAHHKDFRYIKRNYKDALLRLEVAGKIKANPSSRKKGTFGDEVLATFPSVSS